MADPIGVPAFRLGIDFGTSTTTACLRWPDGHAHTLVFDGSAALPSAVYVESDGSIVVGRDAIDAASVDPTRYERAVKRHIDDRMLRFGEIEVPVTALIAAVLARVREEAFRVNPAPDALEVTLTHPAGWPDSVQLSLAQAAGLAGLLEPRLVPDPVAAAAYFVDVLGRPILPGAALVVCDVGAGGFQASAVGDADEGFRVLAVESLAEAGGAELDAALLDHLISSHRARNEAAWRRLADPQNAADRRHRQHLLADVRAAKETLSRTTVATIPVPLLGLEIQVQREEFESLARPRLQQAADLAAAVQRSAGPAPVAALLLVGGTSRIPLIAELLRHSTGLTPVQVDQPDLAVVEGSVRAAGAVVVRAAHSLRPVPVSGQSVAAQPIPAQTVAPQATPARPVPAPAGPVPSGALPPPADPWASRADLPAITPEAVPSDPPHQDRSGPPHVPRPARAMPPLPPGQPAFPYSRPERSGAAYRGGRSRRRWLRAVALAAAGLTVAVVAVAAVGIWARPPSDGAPGGGEEGGSTSTTPYQRSDPPPWLPSGWAAVVDDRQTPAVAPGAATNGGDCTYVSAGVLRVRRDITGVSGCTTTEEVRAIDVRTVAVEAEVSVRSGCAGMWVRTNRQGYFLAVCDDGTVALHLLFRTDPTAATQLELWQPAFNPERVVAGLLADGPNLTVYIDGVGVGTITDHTVAVGRVNLGGFAPQSTGRLDATFTRYRTWAPQTTTGG